MKMKCLHFIDIFQYKKITQTSVKNDKNNLNQKQYSNSATFSTQKYVNISEWPMKMKCVEFINMFQYKTIT